MTLLIAITAVVWGTCGAFAGAWYGFRKGIDYGIRIADERRDREIRQLTHLHTLDPHGDD